MRLVGISAEERPHFLLLMDPFSTPADELLSGLDFAFPDAVKVGGLASGGHGAGSHALYLGQETYRDGVVGVAFTGDIVVDTVVAQGCRPVPPAQVHLVAHAGPQLAALLRARTHHGAALAAFLAEVAGHQ